MKTVRIALPRGWLAAVIGVLGIIGGARQQVWASSGSAGILPASTGIQAGATR